MRKTVLVQAIACALLSSAAQAAVKVEDKTFNTAANMLAYTEFELSGEPLAEAIGLDLDVLDANRADEPTPFDFAAGIEARLHHKDFAILMDEAARLGAPLPVAAQVWQQLNALMGAGWGREDTSSLLRVLER